MAVPMKSEYGPTLGQLLAPSWKAAPRALRVAVLAIAAMLVLAIAAFVISRRPSTYHHGGSVPFHFDYKALHRVAPEQGGYVKLESRTGSGALEYSYTVDPLRLQPYSGSLSGALPLYASTYITALAQRLADFSLVSEGKARVDGIPGYQVYYTAEVDGREMYGRNVLLVPQNPGARDGVEIALLTASTASSEVKAPDEVASTGVLLRPLKTFTFG